MLGLELPLLYFLFLLWCHQIFSQRYDFIIIIIIIIIIRHLTRLHLKHENRSSMEVIKELAILKSESHVRNEHSLISCLAVSSHYIKTNR